MKDYPRTVHFMLSQEADIKATLAKCNSMRQAADNLADELAKAWNFARTLELELIQANQTIARLTTQSTSLPLNGGEDYTSAKDQ